MRFFLIASALILLISCGQKKVDSGRSKTELSFPYQAYLDSIGEDEWFPTIGNDGPGFNAISHKIVYPELPDTLSLSQYADSLLQFYNIILAFNTMAYDVGTAERYMGECDLGLEQADALDSVNLSGVHISEIKDLIRVICQKSAATIRRGEKPNNQDVPEVGQFYDAFNDFTAPLYNDYLDDSEFDPGKIISNYQEIHSKALADTISFRTELLNMVMTETDFQRQCVLARELAYANYSSHVRDDKEIVAVLDKILKADQYSPLLGKLWRMWRYMLQIEILGGRSNDSAMYNLFYNQMRNRIALVYIAYLDTHRNDKLAFKEFVRLLMTHNIVRNSQCMIGNNGNLEEVELFYAVFHPENND